MLRIFGANSESLPSVPCPARATWFLTTDMFRSISYKIALQFTLFVFLLFMVNGALFLVADFTNEQRVAKMRLGEAAHMMAMRMANDPQTFTQALPTGAGDFVRVVDPQGKPIHEGNVYFEGIPFQPEAGM